MRAGDPASVEQRWPSVRICGEKEENRLSHETRRRRRRSRGASQVTQHDRFYTDRQLQSYRFTLRHFIDVIIYFMLKLVYMNIAEKFCEVNSAWKQQYK